MSQSNQALAQFLGLWIGTNNTDLEHRSIFCMDNHIKTIRLLGRNHPERTGGPLDHPWIDKGRLPQYFDTDTLRKRFTRLLNREVDNCEIPFSHITGSANNGTVFHEIENKNFTIVSANEGLELHIGTRIYKPVFSVIIP
jgi:hypothetical protein